MFSYIASLARRTRDWPALTPRRQPARGDHLMQMAKAMAAMDGRDYLLPDDVKARRACRCSVIASSCSRKRISKA